jgi:hypothetical protein
LLLRQRPPDQTVIGVLVSLGSNSRGCCDGQPLKRLRLDSLLWDGGTHALAPRSPHISFIFSGHQLLHSHHAGNRRRGDRHGISCAEDWPTRSRKYLARVFRVALVTAQFKCHPG